MCVDIITFYSLLNAQFNTIVSLYEVEKKILEEEKEEKEEKEKESFFFAPPIITPEY
jgi:hypothetical protein